MIDDFHFTPTQSSGARVDVPFLEDARADYAPHYRSGVSIAQAQQQVTTELSKLGAGVLAFQEGYFGIGKDRRFGYVIRFSYGGVQGAIRVAGLPMRAGVTEKKKAQVLVQALMNVRDWLKASVTARVFNPHSDPLVQYLLVDGQKTLVQAMYDSGRMPLLEAPAIDGEIVE
jgi:hypothetical protein